MYIHDMHVPLMSCVLDFTTDTLYIAHIYISVDVSQVWFRFSIFQHHQLRHTDTPWHTIMFWGLIRSYAYGLWWSRFDFVAFCGEGAATIGIRFWLLDRVSIQSQTCKFHTITIILEWRGNPQWKLFWAKRHIFTQSEWLGYSEKDYLIWPTIIWKGCIALRIFCTQILQICQRLYIHSHTFQLVCNNFDEEKSGTINLDPVQNFVRQPHSPICRQVGARNPGAV